MNRNARGVLYTVRGAAVAALYVLLTLISAVFGLSSGVIQLRLSEALCVLPLFMPEASVGLFVGCILSNLIVPGAVIWDVIFGSLATLIGALGARALRSLPDKHKWVATLPTVGANVLIVPLVLIFGYGVPDAYWFICLTVGLGEILSATVCGVILYHVIKRSRIKF